MKKLKKMARLMALVLLIALATIGVGLGGAVPLSFSKRRDNLIESNLALVEFDADEEESTSSKTYK